MRRTGSRGYSAVSATITSDPEPTEVMPTPSPVIIPTSIVKIGRTAISRGSPSCASRCIEARRRGDRREGIRRGGHKQHNTGGHGDHLLYLIAVPANPEIYTPAQREALRIGVA